MKKRNTPGLRRFFWNLILVVFVLGAGVSVIAFYVLRTQQRIIHSLEEKLAYLKETSVPLRFMVMSREDGIIRARFRFYSADGRELSFFEQSWEGDELVIDSLLVPVADRFLVFPGRVFTDAIAPRDGTSLYRFYDRNGFPGIYDYPGMDEGARQPLADLFQRLVRAESPGNDAPGGTGFPGGDPIKNMFGNAVHDLKRIHQFEIGIVYALLMHTKGGIEIIRE